MKVNKLILEGESLLYHNGEYYCVKDSCEGCKHFGKCKVEEAIIPANSVPAVRSIVKTNNKAETYQLEPTEASNFSQGRFKGDTIPYSEFRVYKRVKSFLNAEHKSQPSIVYLSKENAYYCINQLCSKCPYKDECDVVLEVKPYKDLIVTLDASAQEPRSFTLTTKLTNNLERNWVSIFYNDSIRKLEKLYRSFELLCRLNGLDTNADSFHLKVNQLYFKDKSDLYRLQTAINLHYKTDTDDSLNTLKSVCKDILSHFDIQGLDSRFDLFDYTLRCVMPYTESFPPLGDFHAMNAIAFYGRETLERAYKEDKKTYKTKYRDVAKANALALCYGGSWAVLVRGIGLDEANAKRIHANFYRTLSGFNNHLSVVKSQVKKSLKTANLFGRAIYLNDYNHKDFKVRKLVENRLYNYPIQSLGADMIKVALHKILKYSHSTDTNVFAYDNIHKSYYNRVLSIKESDLTPDLIDKFLSLPEGNMCIVITDDNGNFTYKLKKLVSVSYSMLLLYKLKLEF